MLSNSIAKYDSPIPSCREKLRIGVSFPARLRAMDPSGEEFELDTLLDNLSSGGLYLRLPRRVGQGAKVFVVVRLSRDDKEPAPRVAIRGVVLRAESQPDGSYGVAIAFRRYRFV